MDKILIVDSDRSFLQSLVSGLQKVHQFEILTATTGDEAISILETQKISVFVTDVETPNLDSLDLLAYMTNNCPNTPCIIMTDWGKPWFGKRLSQQSFLYHLEKPFETGALVSAIFVGLNLRDEGSHFKGMTMMSLLPLMELYQKTCRMKVTAADKGNGYLYFRDGVLLDAHMKNMSGEEAAMEIAKWNKISIELSDLPRHRTRKRVKTRLNDMAGFSWIKRETKTENDQKQGAAINPQEDIPQSTEKMLETEDQKPKRPNTQTTDSESALDREFEKEIEDIIEIDDIFLEEDLEEMVPKETNTPKPPKGKKPADKKTAAPKMPTAAANKGGAKNNRKKTPEAAAGSVKATPQPQAAPGPSENPFRDIILKVKKITSCKAIAIANREAEIIAGDQSDYSVNLVLLVTELTAFFQGAQEASENYKGKPPETVTINADDSLILVHHFFMPDKTECFLIIACPPFANAHLIREQFVQILPTGKAS